MGTGSGLPAASSRVPLVPDGRGALSEEGAPPSWNAGLSSDPRLRAALDELGRLPKDKRDGLLADAGALIRVPLVLGHESGQESLRLTHRAALVEVAHILGTQGPRAGAQAALEAARRLGHGPVAGLTGGGKRRAKDGPDTGTSSTAGPAARQAPAPTEVRAALDARAQEELARVAKEFTTTSGVSRARLLNKLQTAARLSGWYEGWPAEEVGALFSAPDRPDRPDWLNTPSYRESLQSMLRPEHVHVLRSLIKTHAIDLMVPELVALLATHHNLLDRMSEISKVAAWEIRKSPELLDPLVNPASPVRNDLLRAFESGELWSKRLLQRPRVIHVLRGRVDLIKHVLTGRAMTNVVADVPAFGDVLADIGDPLLVESLKYEVPLLLAVLETWTDNGMTADSYRDLFANSRLRESLQRHGNVALTLFRVPALLKEALAHPWIVETLARSPMLADVLRDRERFATRIAGSRELLEAAAGNPGVAEYLSRSPSHFDLSQDDATLLVALRQASPRDRSAAVPGGAVTKDPALEIVLAQPAFAKVDPELKRVLRSNPGLLSAPHEYQRLLMKTDLHAGIRAGSTLLIPGLLRAAVTSVWLERTLRPDRSGSTSKVAILASQLVETVSRNPELTDLLYRSPTSAFEAAVENNFLPTLESLAWLVKRIGSDERLPAAVADDNILSFCLAKIGDDKAYDLVMADNATLLRLFRRNLTAVEAFGRKVLENLSRDDVRSTLRALADQPGIPIPTEHWRFLFGNPRLLAVLGLPEHAAARELLLSEPEVFAEAIARQDFTEVLARNALGVNLADLLAKKKRKGKGYIDALRSAVENTGTPALSPEGVHLVAVDHLLAGVFSTASQADAEALVRERYQGPAPDRILNAVRIVRQDKSLLDLAKKSSGFAALFLRNPELAPTLQARPLLRTRLAERSSNVLPRIGHDPTMTRALRLNDGFYTFLMNYPGAAPYLESRETITTVFNNTYWGELLTKSSLFNATWMSNDSLRYLVGLDQVLSKAAIDESPVIGVLNASRDLVDVLINLWPFDADTDPRTPAEKAEREGAEAVRAAVAGSPTLAKALATAPSDLTSALASVPGLAAHIARHGDIAGSPDRYVNLLRNKDLLGKLYEYPELLPTVLSLSAPDLAVTAALTPTLVTALARDRALAGVLARDPAVHTLLREQPRIAVDLAEADPAAPAGPHALRVALGSVRRLAATMVENPTIGEALRSSPHALPAVMRNRELVTHMARGDSLWHAVLRNPVLAEALTPQAVRQLRRRPALVEVLATQGSTAQGPAGMDAASLERVLGNVELSQLLNGFRRFAERFLTTPAWYRRALDDPGFVSDLRALAEADGGQLQQAAADPSEGRLLREVDARAAAAGPRAQAAPTGTATGRAARGGAAARTGRAAQSGRAATAPAAARAGGEAAIASARRPVVPAAEHSVLAEALDRAPQVMDLIEGAQGVAVVQGLVDHPQLLALLVSAPALVEELAGDPGRLASYRFDTYLNSGDAGLEKFDKDFYDYLDRIGVTPQGPAVPLVRDSARTAWSQAVAEREAQNRRTAQERGTRLTAFRANEPRTWQHSGRVVYAKRLKRDILDRKQFDILVSLAKGATQPREASVGAHIALHTHLDSGRSGASFAYVLADDGMVDLLVYGISTLRRGNDYRWDGAGTHYVKGPLDIGVVRNDPAVITSRRLSGTPSEPVPAISTETAGPAGLAREDPRTRRLVDALHRYREGISALERARARPGNAKQRAMQSAEKAITEAVEALRGLGLTPRTPEDRERAVSDT
ncbi:hypothetical protein ACFWA5_50880 [Streptomyces mirabilis]|uniref:hypothetical protein n=1 Tax=Streptomyces mirabilis TaxID=68239 RepID=UPI003649811F